MSNYKVLLFILFLLSAKISYGQSGSQLLNAINKQALEIPSFTDDDSSELTTLGDILKDKKVIGLGEATHGTKEFFVYKAKLIRYLINRYSDEKTPVFRTKVPQLFRGKVRQPDRPVSPLSKSDIFQT